MSHSSQHITPEVCQHCHSPHPSHPPQAIRNQEILNTFTEFQAGLKRIETALSGDPTIGQEGIVSRLKGIETKVEKHDRKFLQMSAAGAAALAVIHTVEWLLKH